MTALNDDLRGVAVMMAPAVMMTMTAALNHDLLGLGRCRTNNACAVAEKAAKRMLLGFERLGEDLLNEQGERSRAG